MTGFWTGLFVVGFVIAFGAYQIALKRNLMAIVDTVWTTGLGVSAIVYFLISDLELNNRRIVIIGIISLWSFRLSYHLFADRVLPGKEDSRYSNLKERWGDHWRRNFSFVFFIQIPFIAAFLFPVSVALQNSLPWRLTDSLAVFVALLALAGEALADHQLSRFKRRGEGDQKVCKEGLWKYSRHPNYFFEWLHWWAYVLFAVGTPSGHWALLGPFAMYLFLRFITGVPPAEYSSVKNRGDAYINYQKTTNAFFPWVPHKPKS